MSLGVHRLWKKALLDWLAPAPAMRLLDVGGGTGDIARGFTERGGGVGRRLRHQHGDGDGWPRPQPR